MKARVRDSALPVLARAVPRPSAGSPDHVLLIQPDHLGDLLLSQPAVRLIREHLATAHLTAVVGPWSETAARLFWPVDDVVTVRFPGFDRGFHPGPLQRYTALRSVASDLLPLDAGRAVVLRPDAWWAAWLAAQVSPHVVSSDDPRVTPFATTTVHLAPDDHAVTRALRIAARLTGSELEGMPNPASHPLDVPFDETARATAVSLLKAASVALPYAVIHPGAGVAVKEWPEHRWRAIAARLIDRGLHVVITGSGGERTTTERIGDGLPGTTSLAGQTPLPVLAAVLSDAAIVVGPDTGPLHVAVAAGTPSVHLFGPSDPQRYGPWGDAARHRVVRAGWQCPRCGDLSSSRGEACGCMLAIEVDAVDTAIEAVMRHD